MSKEIDFSVVAKEKEKLLYNSKAIAKQHELGKKTAHERIQLLLDENSFVEMYALLSSPEEVAGIVVGYGTVDSRPVYVVAQDFTVHAGAISKAHATKICKVLRTALQTGAPVVFFLDSAGIDLDEGLLALEAYAEIYAVLSELNGVCPTIAVVSGPCIGASAVFSQLCNISIAVEGLSKLCMYGPQVVSTLYSQELSLEEIAGVKNANAQGAYSLLADKEEDAVFYAKRALSFLPDCNSDYPLYVETADLNKLVDFNTSSSANDILLQLSDDSMPLCLYAEYEPSITTALARVGGHAVALLLSDGARFTAGALQKAAKFVSFADSFNLPILSVLHSEGLEIPDAKSQLALIQAQSKLIYNFASATVPKISLLLGKVFGQAYTALASKSNADMVFAFPEAIVSALSPEAAIQVVWQDKIKESTLPVEEAKASIAKDYVVEKASSLVAAKAGLVDDIIEAPYARMHIVSALEMLASKSISGFSKKHGNLPL